MLAVWRHDDIRNCSQPRQRPGGSDCITQSVLLNERETRIGCTSRVDDDGIRDGARRCDQHMSSIAADGDIGRRRQRGVTDLFFEFETTGRFVSTIAEQMPGTARKP